MKLLSVFLILNLFYPVLSEAKTGCLTDSTLSGKIHGFVTSPYFNEQICAFNYAPEIRVFINAPESSKFNPNQPTEIILYALPNGNTIEHTIGKKLNEEDDWHFDLQHIGAQTRFLRNHINQKNLIVVYLESKQKSWPAWKNKHSDYPQIIDSLLEYLINLFKTYNPSIVLSGHSGGGSFTFGFFDSVEKIPDIVKRITFLDSDYGYNDLYGHKILEWLKESPDNHLCVIAYDDSKVLYNGKRIVSDTGGTWYRSKLMKNYLGNHINLREDDNEEFIKWFGLSNQVQFILKKNPEKLILHTKQVELNGFIQGIVSGTILEYKDYDYYGDRAYSQFIQDEEYYPNILMIPPRPTDALTGSEFMQRIIDMTFEEREKEIYDQISCGNIPEFLRTLMKITSYFEDTLRVRHKCVYEVIPDYLSIGSDEDYCRIPMDPITAQKLADLFGTLLPTSKLVDDIYEHCEVKLEPITYYPIGENNTLISKFIEHNKAIQIQLDSIHAYLGQLVGGIKKDVVISNKMFDPIKKNRVVIYGWHRLNGVPIQPLTNIHNVNYVDYSHGIRLIKSKILLDDQLVTIDSILKNPLLYKILSNETGPIEQTTYIEND